MLYSHTYPLYPPILHVQVLASKDTLKEQEENDDHDDFTTVLPAKSADAKKGADGADAAFTGPLTPMDVDAFWLQRQISALYDDKLTAQQKTEAALAIVKR